MQRPAKQHEVKPPKVKPAAQVVIKYHQKYLAVAAWWGIAKQKLYQGKELRSRVGWSNSCLSTQQLLGRE